MIDLHSHILFGVDDGVRTLEESVKVGKELERQGINEVVATPHYIDETNYTSTRAANEKILRKVKKALKDAGVDIKVYLGNEIYISERILDLVRAKKIVGFSKSKYLLVELPLSGKYPNARDILLELINEGYQVVLAHPERYATVQKNLGTLKDFQDIGVLFQGNLGSLVGRYGKAAKKTLIKMMKAKMIFGFGSDIHRSHDDDYLARAMRKLKKYYNEKEIEEVLVENPRKALKTASRRGK